MGLRYPGRLFANVSILLGGGQALGHVADGRLEGFWENRINAWDVCAGLVLAVEAGAVVEDFFGGEGPARANRCVAAAPGVIAALRAAIA